MRRPLALLTAAATAITAVAIGASPAQAAPSTIDWQPCAGTPGVECGTLSVPVDWSRPWGQRIDLALARRKATERIGSVLVIPGGPGGSGVEMVRESPVLSETVARRFDIVGLDPRGANGSAPIQCDLAIALEQYPVAPRNQAEFDQAMDHSRRYADSCRRLSGPIVDFVDSVSVARDMDAVRAALGEAKLTSIGHSYGTLAEQMYAELFPNRVRALTIDSTMDHSLSSALQFLGTESLGVQQSFDEFVKWNARTPDSPLAGQDVRAVYRDLLARAERGELPLTPEDLRFLTFQSFYDPDWRTLAATYSSLQANVTARAWSPATVADPLLAMFCQDWSLPVRSYADLAAYRSVIQRTVAPDIQVSPLAEYVTVACAGWTQATRNPQHRLHITTTAPILVVNGLFDPATPYQWATNVASQSRSLHLLTYDGWGHVAYDSGSTCVVDAVDTYLLTVRTPPPGTHCAAVQPGDALGVQPLRSARSGANALY
jgi:pimeloyl-ACP methyl ester carboxylesterase